MSQREIKQKLYETFEKSGIDSTLKAQLRLQLLQLFQSKQNTRLKKTSPPSKTLFDQAMLALVVEYLQHCGYPFTVSVLLPESGLSINRPQDILSPHDIGKFLAIREGESPYSRAFFDHYDHSALEEVFHVIIREETKQNPSVSRDTQTDSIDEASTGSIHLVSALEQRMKDYQRSCDLRMEREIAEKIGDFKKNEIESIVRNERLAYDKQLAELRASYDEELHQKINTLEAEHQHRLMQLKEKETLLQKKEYLQRQHMLDDLQRLSQREHELTLNTKQSVFEKESSYEAKIAQLTNKVLHLERSLHEEPLHSAQQSIQFQSEHSTMLQPSHKFDEPPIQTPLPHELDKDLRFTSNQDKENKELKLRLADLEKKFSLSLSSQIPPSQPPEFSTKQPGTNLPPQNLTKQYNSYRAPFSSQQSFFRPPLPPKSTSRSFVNEDGDIPTWKMELLKARNSLKELEDEDQRVQKAYYDYLQNTKELLIGNKPQYSNILHLEKEHKEKEKSAIDDVEAMAKEEIELDMKVLETMKKAPKVMDENDIKKEIDFELEMKKKQIEQPLSKEIPEIQKVEEKDFESTKIKKELAPIVTKEEMSPFIGKAEEEIQDKETEKETNKANNDYFVSEEDSEKEFTNQENSEDFEGELSIQAEYQEESFEDFF